MLKHHDLILNTEVGDTIQGHVGQRTKQVFETLMGTPFSQPKLKLSGYEFVLRDQFQNYYHKMRAVLFDGDMYDVDQWIKPTMMMRTGGGHADMADWNARHKLRITEELLRELRETGALAFGRMNMEIIKARSLSAAPVAIETQDITHQANVLEDALRSAKTAAGERVIDEPTAPDDFQPLTAEKVPQGTRLEGPRPGEVFATVEAAPVLTPPAAPATTAA